MATKKLNTRIQNKIDSEANWNNKPDFIPLKGEMIVYSKDANNKAARIKFGDGVTKLSELNFTGASIVSPSTPGETPTTPGETPSTPSVTPVKKPKVKSTLTYNKSSQTPTWVNYDSSKMTLSGTTSAINAGTYIATFTPLTGYCWENDESTSAINVAWTINKAYASLILDSTLLGIDSTFENKTFTYTSNSTGTITVSYEVYDSTGVLIEDAFETSVNGTSITISKSLEIDEISYGTITINQAATTNYKQDKAEITIERISGLDEYSWEDIKTYATNGSSVFDIGATGDTKTITLTPNQRIRLPQGEETVKVFLADTYTSDTGICGVLFTGFKDDKGKDVCITPDPKIREKQWIPDLTGITFLNAVDTTTFVETVQKVVGTHKLRSYCDDNLDSVFSTITITASNDFESGEVTIGDNQSLLEWKNGGELIATTCSASWSVNAGKRSEEADTQIQYQYIDRELYNFLKLIIKGSQSFNSSLVKWIEKPSYSIDEVKEVLQNVDPCASDIDVLVDNPYLIRINETRLEYFNTMTGQAFTAYDQATGSWKSSSYRYMTFQYDNVNDSIDNLWWIIDNTAPIPTQSIYRYCNLDNVSTESLNELFGLYDRHYATSQQGNSHIFEFSVHGSYNNTEFNQLTIDLENKMIYADSNPVVGSGIATIEFLSSEVEDQINILNTALNILNSVNTVCGSWIWNESVTSSFDSLSKENVINISFRAGDNIEADGLPQLQYCINPTNSDGSLSYDSSSGVTKVVSDGIFHSEYAAMHFGDEPQSVPKYFYDFLVANADYMSGGFGYADWIMPKEESCWEQSYLRDRTVKNNNNSLLEALPEDFKNVLSDVKINDSTIVDKIMLPYPNEIYDDTSFASEIVTNDRLGYGNGKFINYYSAGNSRVKHDIWNKTAPIKQYTAGLSKDAIYTAEDNFVLVSENGIPLNYYTDSNSSVLTSAGLAPIFLIGNANECEHKWGEVQCISDNEDTHTYHQTCTLCGKTKSFGTTGHGWESHGLISDWNGTHYEDFYCEDCGATKSGEDENCSDHATATGYRWANDSNGHWTTYACDCGYTYETWEPCYDNDGDGECDSGCGGAV